MQYGIYYKDEMDDTRRMLDNVYEALYKLRFIRPETRAAIIELLITDVEKTGYGRRKNK
jgi:hypothetical protein